MKKSRQIAALEARHGRPIAEIVAAYYERHGNVTDAAAALGVSRTTYSYWKTRLTEVEGRETERVLIARRRAA